MRWLHSTISRLKFIQLDNAKLIPGPHGRVLCESLSLTSMWRSSLVWGAGTEVFDDTCCGCTASWSRWHSECRRPDVHSLLPSSSARVVRHAATRYRDATLGWTNRAVLLQRHVPGASGCRTELATVVFVQPARARNAP